MSESATANRIADGLDALTRWTAELDWVGLPETTRRRVATVFADDLAAIIAARDEPELNALADRMTTASGPAESTLFDGSGRRLDRYSAALLNGGAADWCELDSGYRRAVCHAGLYCLPALLAEGEARDATLEEMLRALAIGYETVARIAQSFPFQRLILHPHATLAVIGAAATVSALRRHSASMAAMTIASAATMAIPGPFNHAVEGALIRNLWAGMGAQTGIRAADWVELGITGRREGVHDVFVDGLGAEMVADALDRDLGARWAVEDGYHKIHACCQYGHSAAEATLAALEDLPAGASSRDIAAIQVEIHPLGALLDKRHPPTTLAAKFSLQHVLATTAHHGHAGAEAFQVGSLDDPEIRRLRDCVTITDFDPLPDWPNDRPARLVWRLRDGTRIERECLSAEGGPDRPFPPERIQAKIQAIVADPYPELSRVLAAIQSLETGILATRWREIIAESSPPSREGG